MHASLSVPRCAHGFLFAVPTAVSARSLGREISYHYRSSCGREYTREVHYQCSNAERNRVQGDQITPRPSSRGGGYEIAAAVFKRTTWRQLQKLARKTGRPIEACAASFSPNTLSSGEKSANSSGEYRFQVGFYNVAGQALIIENAYKQHAFPMPVQKEGA